MKRTFACFTSFAVLALSAACSSSSTGSASQSQVVSPLCGTDPRAESYEADMVQKGAAGTFGVKLIDVSPWPVNKGDNTWTVQIVDGAGQPATGATFTVKPFMPDHGHGSSIIPDIEPATGDATFAINRLNVFMPGVWTFTFSITKAGVADTAVVTFCVPE